MVFAVFVKMSVVNELVISSVNLERLITIKLTT